MKEIKKIKKIYVASPLGAPTQEEIEINMAACRRYKRLVNALFECHALALHDHEILPDLEPELRALAIQWGLQLIEHCDAIAVCGDRISPGMKGEVQKAEKEGLRIYVFNKEVHGKLKETLHGDADLEYVEIPTLAESASVAGGIQLVKEGRR